MQIIGPKIEVPANASRLFKTHNEAVSQPIASVQLAISIENPFIFNLSFSPTEVIYDFNYFLLIHVFVFLFLYEIVRENCCKVL